MFGFFKSGDIQLEIGHHFIRARKEEYRGLVFAVRGVAADHLFLHRVLIENQRGCRVEKPQLLFGGERGGGEKYLENPQWIILDHKERP